MDISHDTKRLLVIGVVARGGKVVAQPSPKVKAKKLSDFLRRHVDGDDSVLLMDEFPAYLRMGEWVQHFHYQSRCPVRGGADSHQHD